MPPFEKAFLIEIIRSKVELPISPPNKLDLRFSALLRCSRNWESEFDCEMENRAAASLLYLIDMQWGNGKVVYILRC